MEELLVINVQLALYFGKHPEFPEGYAEKILASPFKDLIGSKPLITSLPTIPEFNEAPIVVAGMDNSECRLTISRTRSDIYIPGKAQNYLSIKEGVHKLFSDFYNLVEEQNIERLGLVFRFFKEANDNANTTAKLLSIDPPTILSGKSNQGASIKFVVHDEIGGLLTHNVAIVNTGELTQNEKKQAGIIITRDFNVHQKKNAAISWEEVANFISIAESKLNTLDLLKAMNIDEQ